MNFRRVRFTPEVSKKLSLLKARTGITPNILCRIGFCLSIETPSIPEPDEFQETGDQDKEIDRPVLLGAYDPLFIAMIKERCQVDGRELSDEFLFEYFRAHIHRGVHLLYKRVKRMPDMIHLIPELPEKHKEEAEPQHA